MPWSMGKDSNVLIWLARKAFFGQVPFPVLHIDTTYEFPEMLEFREWATKHYKLNLIVKINAEARARGVGYETHDPVTVTHELKTVALQQVLAEYKWDALITGIRRDEDPTRAKERYFSPRNAQFEWDYKDQPPEFWGQFATTACKRRTRPRAAVARLDRGGHLALHPARKHSDSENVFRAKRKTISFVRLQSDHAANREQRRRRSTKSSPNWKRQRRASAPVARRIITSATRCRNCARKDSYDRSKRATLNVQRSTFNSDLSRSSSRFRRPCRSWQVDADRSDSARHRFVARRKDRADQEGLRGGGDGVRVRLSARCVARGAGAKHHHRYDADSVSNGATPLRHHRCAGA